MPDDVRPLSPAEVDALEANLIDNDFLLHRLIKTVRDRERQRDTLYWHEEWEKMRTERDELERQLAEARKDTERLDWLARMGYVGVHTHAGFLTQVANLPMNREAIDRARVKEAE